MPSTWPLTDSSDTFATLLSLTVPMQTDRFDLALVRETTEGRPVYYALANSVRIRPISHEDAHHEESAYDWFGELFHLYQEARVRHTAPHD